MAQDHVSYLAVDHVPVISVGREGAPLALWLPPLGMTKDDMRPVLESLPPDGAQRFAAVLGEDVRVNVRAGLGHIDGRAAWN